MAHIFYVPEQGFSWTPVAKDHKAIRPLVQRWGDPAMYYLCNFSHPFSLYSTITDPDERDKNILDEMRSQKLATKTHGGATHYPSGLYKDTDYEKAEYALINELTSIPDWKTEQFLRSEVEKYRKILTSIEYSQNDPDKLKKQAEVAKNIQGLIKEASKNLLEHETMLQGLINKAGIISLDELLNLV